MPLLPVTSFRNKDYIDTYIFFLDYRLSYSEQIRHEHFPDIDMVPDELLNILFHRGGENFFFYSDN